MPMEAASEGAAAGVAARGVRRSFGRVEALRGVDLTAPYGEVTALVGPNGSGKTTLLLVLATLLQADGGGVEVAGFDPVTDPGSVRARVGWMPDVFGTYEQLSVREYLTFFGQAYRLPAAEIRTRVGELLALVDLESHAGEPVRVLSRGQKQRLGVARALVHRPEVLLLDEPAAGLDPRARVQLRRLLRTLAADGTAVLVSSHILSELEEIADRVVVMDRGVTVGTHRLGAGDTSTAAARRRWRIRALDEEPLLAALDQRGLAYGDPAPTGVEVELGSDDEAAELLAELVAAGVRVVSCAPAVGGVEAAYIEATESAEERE